jgi:organic hydroperoxide reductase OsmC/OhrA
MSRYSMTVSWELGDARFEGGRYSRAHLWSFDGGAQVRASSSPSVVPIPYSDPAGVDPEEAFVASLASCHMLWFLSLAAQRGFCVQSYRDSAEGIMAAGPDGRLRMVEVSLQPHTVFAGSRHPSLEELRALHHQAHEECFIASSVTTRLTTVPTFEVVP